MQRLRHSFVVFGIVAIALTGCGSSRGKANAAAIEEVPLGARTRPAVVAVGDRLVVYGGMTPGGRKTEALDDGAVFDGATGVWEKIRPSPTDPLYLPAAVPSGDGKVLVVGTGCKVDQNPTGDIPACAPGGLEAALLDPVSRRWEQVVPPPLSLGGRLLTAAPLGEIDGGPAFLFNDVAWQWGTQERAWRKLPSPAMNARRTCFAGGSVVAVGYDDRSSARDLVAPAPGETRSNTQPSTARPASLEAEVFTAGAWQAVSRPPTAPEAPAVMGLVCAGPDVLAYPAETGKNRPFGFRFDVATRAWSQAKTPPDGVSVEQLSAWTGKEILIWTASGPFLYSPSGDAWRHVGSAGLEQPEQIIWFANQALLVYRDSGAGDLRIASFQPGEPK